MRCLMHRIGWMIAGLVIVSSFLGITPVANGQPGVQGTAIPYRYPVLPSRFAFGAGGFSGPINSVVPVIASFPSLDYFPGTSIPTIRGLWTGTIPNGPGVAKSDVFGPFYANPLAATRPYAFGAPLNAIPQSANATVAPSAANVQSPYVPSVSPAAPTAQQNSQSLTIAPDSATIVSGTMYKGTASPTSVRVRVPALGIPSSALSTRTSPPAGAPQPREDLQQIISQSSALSDRNSIQVFGSGSEVILRGSVISDYDRQLAEALLLLSPAVQTVRNELTVGQ